MFKVAKVTTSKATQYFERRLQTKRDPLSCWSAIGLTVGPKSVANSIPTLTCDDRFFRQQLTCSTRHFVMKLYLFCICRITYTLVPHFQSHKFFCNLMSRQLMLTCATCMVSESYDYTSMQTLISRSWVSFLNMPKATEESVAKPQLQILVRCQLAAL